ncbi:MAG TPA: PmeII family type II restriction endonuclease [Azospirillaceae bacterium]|nr:PmeII family type II restriction endonuclease [Azospirillaceae bacterium]
MIQRRKAGEPTFRAHRCGALRWRSGEPLFLRKGSAAHSGTVRTGSYRFWPCRLKPFKAASSYEMAGHQIRDPAASAQDRRIFSGAAALAQYLLSDRKAEEQIKEHAAHACAKILDIEVARSRVFVEHAYTAYIRRMQNRFTKLKFSERLKRTNPFLLSVRGIKTVNDWAKMQIRSTLIASEEEAMGHLFEAIAKFCCPGAREPLLTDDFDFEVEVGDTIKAFQVKGSWDCMPMSSRKNLSATILRNRAYYKSKGKKFVGIFAPAYGKATTTSPEGQEYISMSSKEFWTFVGGGKKDFDLTVVQLCTVLCTDFRRALEEELIPQIVEKLAEKAKAEFGTPDGSIDYGRLMALVNKAPK